MTRLRNWKSLVVIFVLALVFTASFTFMSSESAKASRCECWVMYCTVEPPVYCWEECVPCPPIWP